LSSSALPLTPKGKDYAMSAGETDEKKEEQPDGLKYTINKTLEILSKVKYRFDNCGDARYPSAIVTTKPFTKALLDIKNKGIKIRVITEITKDNLSYCKELMQVVNEVRHLDGVKGNFTVTDTEYVSYAISSEEARPSLTKAVLTISKELVQQQQHFFDMLWNKAIPAKQKVMEMESGIMLPERTEIINGAYNILRLTLESVPHIRESLDNCIDSNSPVSFFYLSLCGTT
jgi:two-component system sensor histidine kinase VicK